MSPHNILGIAMMAINRMPRAIIKLNGGWKRKCIIFMT